MPGRPCPARRAPRRVLAALDADFLLVRLFLAMPVLHGKPPLHRRAKKKARTLPLPAGYGRVTRGKSADYKATLNITSLWYSMNSLCDGNANSGAMGVSSNA